MLKSLAISNIFNIFAPLEGNKKIKKIKKK